MAIMTKSKLFQDVKAHILECDNKGVTVRSITLVSLWEYVGDPAGDEQGMMQKSHKVHAIVTTDYSFYNYENTVDFTCETEINSTQELIELHEDFKIRLAGICPVSLIVQNKNYRIMGGLA